MDSIIKILGFKGKLSNFLNAQHIQNNSANLNELIEDKYLIIKVATFSPTLRDDCLEKFNEEIAYYKNLLKEIDKEKEFLIYISSQTLELTNNTFYSKAKFEVENLIKSNLNKYTIIRPGMIFNKDESKFLLSSMNNASNSFITFFDDYPQTTVCDISDIYNLIIDISDETSFYSTKIINLGIRRYRFIDLQNLANKKKFRIPILSYRLLKFISIFNIRLRSYCTGQSITCSPEIAWKSYFD